MPKAKRRGNNEGTITQRKDGRWEARYWDASHKRRCIYGKTRQEVRDKLVVAQKAVQDAIELPSEKMTVKAYSHHYLETVSDRLRDKTYDSYEGQLRNHIIPNLGHHKLVRLSPIHVGAFYKKLIKAGKKPRTVDTIHGVLRAMLKLAMSEEAVYRNVAVLASASLPKNEVPQKPMLSQDEIKRFIAASRYERLEALFVVAIDTGIRQGEMLGLTWDRVDLDKGVLNITKQLGKRTGRGYLLVEPKTKTSVRHVKISDPAIAALTRHRVSQNEEKLAAGKMWAKGSDLKNLVFTRPDGLPITGWYVRKEQLKPLWDRAGISTPYTFHDLRHLAASWLLGTLHQTPTTVSQMLGHASPAVTLRVYAHAMPNSQDEAVDAMNAALADKSA